MFSLTLLDHLRLTFSQVVERHKAHTNTAQAHARWNRWLRGSEAVLMGGVTIAAIGAAYGDGRAFAIAAGVMAGMALIILLVHLTFDFETSAQVHATCSTHLWQIRERYRALLSDLHDGVLDVAEARLRRDKLMEELRIVYEKTPITQLKDPALRRSTDPGDGKDLADEEVKLFLPKLPNSEQQPSSPGAH
jgi:SMODS and SLOG-associating 2TM effector domain family 4